jgi:uncharacterized repeat protein (TIGR02543 family)
MLESGTFSGKIVLDASVENALAESPEKAWIKKTDANVADNAIGIPEGYKWVKDSDGLTSTLKKVISVIFNLNGGIIGDNTENVTVYVVPGQTITGDQKPSDPTKDGYTFTGWYEDGSETPFDFESTMITEDVTLTAQWKVSATANVSATLALNESIDVIFYVKNLSDTVNVSRYTVEYSFAGGNTVTKVLGTDVEIDDEGRYAFTVAQCAAKQMTDIILFTLKYDGNEIVSLEYSVQKYCENKIKDSKTTAALRELCYAVLDYGASAQTFFSNYNAEKMANANYTDMATVNALTIPNNWPVAVTGNASEAGITKATATLDTVSRTELYFLVTPVSSNISDYTIQVEDITDNRAAAYVASMQEDGRILVRVTRIAAKYLGHQYKLSITYNGNTFTITYSPMTYAYSKQNAAYGLGTLCKAMYQYYLKAEAFFE